MPIAPMNKKCRELGCKSDKTWNSTFCNEHGGGLTTKMKDNKKLYATKYWQKQRQIQLSRHPLCAACMVNGKIVQALHIDHVFPHRQNTDRFKINLFQSLCAPCHTLKTQDESNGVFNHYTADGIVKYIEDDYKRVVYGSFK
jgi:hypothetical protein